MSLMNHIKWRDITTVGILTMCLVTAVFVRVKEVDQLQDKYLSGYDAYFYYRQAKTIIKVGEFYEPPLSHWFRRYGLLFIFPLFGLLLVIYIVTKAYCMPKKMITGTLAITLAATFLSTHPNMQQRLMETIYLGSVILFIGTIAVSYFFRTFNRESYQPL